MADARRVLVATGNPGKVDEICAALADLGWEFVTAADLGLEPLDVDETGETFAENAVLKAEAYRDAFSMPALADDSGLEVDALGREPGVRSARFAGEGATDADNNDLLLARLADVPVGERTARFRSVVALADESGTVTADGACEGSIGLAPTGDGGFGYDPLFRPDAAPGSTMAQLPMGEKNALSHRGAALRALRDALGTAS